MGVVADSAPVAREFILHGVERIAIVTENELRSRLTAPQRGGTAAGAAAVSERARIQDRTRCDCLTGANVDREVFGRVLAEGTDRLGAFLTLIN